MKKFEFKLDALLKLRNFKEQKLKIELGQILKDIASCEDGIATAKEAIDLTYLDQQKHVGEMVNGNFLQFYPQYIAGKRAEIESLDNKLFSLRKKYDEKLKELKIAMGDVKIIDNMKESAKQLHRREFEKKIQERIEESVMNRYFNKEVSK